MTKSITDLAREAGMNFAKLQDSYCKEVGLPVGTKQSIDDVRFEQLEKFAALHRAAIIEELTGEMPEPLGFMWQHDETGRVGFAEESQRQPWRKGNPRLAIVRDIYTERQMREYAAGLVLKERESLQEAWQGSKLIIKQLEDELAKKDAEIAVLGDNLIEMHDAKLKLQAEVERLTADARRYQAIRNGLEVEPDNSGIVVSLIDDFGGETLRGDKADAAIDEAMK